MRLRNFFLNKNQAFIYPFSIYHILILVITVFFLFLVYKKRDKINLKKSRVILSLILIINWLLRRGTFILYGVYNINHNLDINFCNFTSILILLYCLTGNKKIYKYCSYLVFIGPLLSMIFPSGSFSIFNYSFYSFLILHNIVFIFNFIFLLKEDIYYERKDFKKVSLFIMIYLSVIYIIDIIFKFDYNMPSSFINVRFLNLNEFVIKKPISSYLIMIIVILVLLFITNKILLNVKRKQKNV